MDAIALSDQAYAAADEVITRVWNHDLVPLDPGLDATVERMLRTMFAWGWIVGRGAGGKEAEAAIALLSRELGE